MSQAFLLSGVNATCAAEEAVPRASVMFLKPDILSYQRALAFRALILLALAAPLLLAQKKENARVMGLVELYGITASIVYGEEDEFAANLLLEFLKPHLKGIKTIPAKGSKPRNDDLVIYVGNFEANPPSAKTFKSLGYSLNWDALTEGSFLLKTFRKEGKTTVFVTGKDRLGTLYATHDLKNYYLRVEMGRVLLNELNLAERAQLKYRWFRNWDYRTNWELAGAGSGSGSESADPAKPDPYRNTPDAYLRDLKKTVDVMSERRLNGLTLWGFLRDSHGGVAAAQELCRYAAERGVRILPGIGVTGYGGIFSEGDHAFNFNAWTKAHPELRAVDRAGNFLDGTLCLEKPQNRQWYREGLQWLYQNFRIGGISLELGPSFVCHSEDCKKARQAMGGNDPDYSKDLARLTGFVAEEVRKLDPKSWVSYLTGTGFDVESIQTSARGAMPVGQGAAAFPPEFIQRIPEFALAQWELEPMLKAGSWPSPFKAPGKHGLGLLRWGTAAAKSQHELYWKRVEAVAHQAISSNLEGLAMYGELSPDRPNIELSYLIFSELAFNPAADLDEFFRFRVSRLYGGEEPARRLMKIVQLLEDETGMLPANYDEALRLARQAAEVSDRSGKERWNRLIQYVEKLKK
ncbi:MAG: hypothetical protein L0387_06940 [Acidobacteria bacterium]|nr:hypothetical protein [Acidobacteriota bacterium]MCI0722721.1 hypothetical protein [Acidobacteriota bacterium]